MKQTERVLQYIREHGSITQIDALNQLGVLRLASRINDLRRLGNRIATTMITVQDRYGNDCRVASYSLLERN